MLMRVTSEGIHSSINIRYFELNDIPYIIDKCTDDPDKALILAEMSNDGLVIQKDRNWYATTSKD